MRFYLSLLFTSIKSSVSLRTAFLVETILIFLNNSAYMLLWWIFFREFQSIGSWHMREVVLTIALISGSYGLMIICFGGARRLSHAISTGQLDPFLTQPKNPLLHIIMSTSYPKGWGHFITAAVFLFMFDLTEAKTLFLFTIGCITGCLVLTSVRIMVNSLAFWAGSMETLSERYLDSVFLFSTYPTNIYSGWLQFVMYTIVPAGIMSYLPVEMIREFSSLKFFALIFFAVVFPYFAVTFFFKGLRRYESGNQIAVRV